MLTTEDGMRCRLYVEEGENLVLPVPGQIATRTQGDLSDESHTRKSRRRGMPGTKVPPGTGAHPAGHPSLPSRPIV